MVFLAAQFIFVMSLQNLGSEESRGAVCITNLITVTARERANKNGACKLATVYEHFHAMHSMVPIETGAAIASLQQWQRPK